MPPRDDLIATLSQPGTRCNLFGLPGVGKTWALGAIAQRRHATRVELDGESGDLGLRLMSAIDPSAETLEGALDALSPGHILLLDHADHSAEELIHLLPRLLDVPKLDILVASRTALMLPGLRERRLMGLARKPALELMRTLATQWASEDTSRELDPLLELLDGHPLAIALAARRARIMTPGELTERLLERVDALRDARLGVSLSAMLEEVWDGLTEHAKLCCARMSVFASPAPLSDLEQVVVDERLERASLLDALDELDARGALHIDARRFRPSPLLMELVEHEDPVAARARHVSWVDTRCAAWRKDAGGDRTRLLRSAAASCSEILRAWAHLGDDTQADDLRAVIAALGAMRTSTMTWVGTDLHVDPIEVDAARALQRADALFSQGQREGARALLMQASRSASGDVALSARIFGALARVQRDMGQWYDAAHAFREVADAHATLGDRARSRRYTLRQVDALGRAGATRRAAQLLERLLADTRTGDEPPAARVAASLANMLVTIDPARARDLLDAHPEASSPLIASDLETLEGHHARALEILEGTSASPDTSRRIVELASVLGHHERAAHAHATGAHGDFAEGWSLWMQGDPTGACTRWSQSRDSVVTALASAARGEPLDERTLPVQTAEVFESWSSGAHIDQDRYAWVPGALSAGWLAHLLGWVPREGPSLTTSRALAEARAERAWLILAHGAGFCAPGGTLVDLRAKPTLSRLLGALALAYQSAPGDALSFDDAFASGWPDQPHTAQESARNRLRVAMRRLRNEGLRDLIVTAQDGYLIDPGATVTVSS